MRSLLSGLVLVAGGCAFTPGQPWGELTSAGAEASLSLPDDRVDGSFNLLTAKEYALALDIVVASISSLSLDQAESSLELAIGTQTGLRQAPTALPLDCEEPCVFERGEVIEGRLFVDELRVRALVFDPTGRGRVPAGGLPIDVTIVFEEPARGPLGVTMERFEPVRWDLLASFALAPSFMDAFDFEDGVEASAIEQAGRDIMDDSVLSVSLTPAEDS